MLKKDLVKAIKEKISCVESCTIVKVYANGMGVGYDLVVELSLKNGDFKTLNAKAHKHSWADTGHNRAHSNVFYDYKGTCDIYREEVTGYWCHYSDEAYDDYFGRFQKQELVEFLQDIS